MRTLRSGSHKTPGLDSLLDSRRPWSERRPAVVEKLAEIMKSLSGIRHRPSFACTSCNSKVPISACFWVSPTENFHSVKLDGKGLCFRDPQDTFHRASERAVVSPTQTRPGTGRLTAHRLELRKTVSPSITKTTYRSVSPSPHDGFAVRSRLSRACRPVARKTKVGTQIKAVIFAGFALKSAPAQANRLFGLWHCHRRISLCQIATLGRLPCCPRQIGCRCEAR